MGRSRSVYSGGYLEIDLCYPNGDERVRKIDAAEFGEVEWQPFRDALQEVLKGKNASGYTESEQWNPPTRWMSDVHAFLADKLNIDDYSDLRILPAVATSLDHNHGIDCVVQYTDKHTGKVYIATVDFSASRLKRENHQYKADILVTDTGAESQYYELEEFYPDVDHQTREEELDLGMQRKEAVANVLQGVLEEKIASHNHLYKKRKNTRRRISTLINRDESQFA